MYVVGDERRKSFNFWVLGSKVNVNIGTLHVELCGNNTDFSVYISVGVGAFVIGLSQISSFFSFYMIIFKGPRSKLCTQVPCLAVKK